MGRMALLAKSTILRKDILCQEVLFALLVGLEFCNGTDGRALLGALLNSCFGG